MWSPDPSPAASEVRYGFKRELKSYRIDPRVVVSSIAPSIQKDDAATVKRFLILSLS
jgi:hypothetical protein